MNEGIVTFKATVHGLVLLINENEPFGRVLVDMEEKLKKSDKFFKGASINVKYRGRKLTEEEKEKILEFFREKAGVNVLSFEEDKSELPAPAEQQAFAPESYMFRRHFFKETEEGMAKFHRGTIRSGQVLSFEGNVIVIGDVNPGGEVIATGNVIVMGSLRGVACAGANGNREAIVAALNLQPVRLRIADVIARAPDDAEVRNVFVPEIAYVKDGVVYIEKFLPQR